MPQRAASSFKFRRFAKGVSYKSGDIGDKLFDANNMLLVQDKAQTRWGLKRVLPEAFGADIDSLSFYVTNDGATKKLISKAGTIMYAAAPADDLSFSSIKTGLTAGIKHNAVTMNGRHIIALGSDGLFSYDGTNFAELGITAPTAPSITADNGSGTLTDKTYVVAITYGATGVGFETNIGTASNSQATSGGDDSLIVASIPVSSHPLVDVKNVYLKNTTDSGSYLFVAQISNATTTYSITANPASTSDNPPTGEDPPLSGGGKYLGIFNGQLIAAGNSTFPSDVFFSNADEPDGWSPENQLIKAAGNGPITGLAVGHYSDSLLTQFLVIFKRGSLTIYSENSGPSDSSQTYIEGVGCVSHKTIIIRDGDVYFLSAYGWRRISNGRLDEKNLAEGDVDDIFRVNSFAYSINKQELENAFSVYYSEAHSYMTWVKQTNETSFSRCYNYHADLDAFMPLALSDSLCATIGDDVNGEETVYLARENGRIYTYNMRNGYVDELVDSGFRLDEDMVDVDILTSASGLATQSISTFILQNWLPNDDFDSSYNFRSYFIEAISGTDEDLSATTVKAFINFTRSDAFLYDYSIFNQEGFTLDVSMLDVDALADDRARIRAVGDINLAAKNILIGVYQNVSGALLQLLATQLNFSKNGNANI